VSTPVSAPRLTARSRNAGLAGEPPARPLRSFAPSGSPFAARPPTLARGRSLRRCSPGLLPLQSLLQHDTGSGLSQRRTLPGTSPDLARLREPSASLRLRDPSSDTWAHEPRIRRRAESIESAHHRQAATQLEPAIASLARASRQPRHPTLTGKA